MIAKIITEIIVPDDIDPHIIEQTKWIAGRYAHLLHKINTATFSTEEVREQVRECICDFIDKNTAGEPATSAISRDGIKEDFESANSIDEELKRIFRKTIIHIYDKENDDNQTTKETT